MTESTRIDVPALKRAIIDCTGPGKEFTRRSLSLAASGGKNADLVRDLISRGQDRKVSFETAAGIAKALGREVGEFLVGTTGPAPAALESIRVVGAIEAGAWREQEQWDEDRQFDVLALPSPVSGAVRFGLEVVGLSMNLLFLPGSVLDCIRIPDTEGIYPRDGDIVVVQRRRGELYETTCKRLEQLPDGNFQLRAESSRPEFSEPIYLGRPDNGHFADEEISIIGIVNTAIRQIFRR